MSARRDTQALNQNEIVLSYQRVVEPTRPRLAYVLITPAKNESAFIEQTIRSVIKQRVLPLRWVIVDDGSTDRTAEIVLGYTTRFTWIELLQMPSSERYAFSAKARCVNAAFAHVRALDFAFVASVDADISFDEEYFEFILNQFTLRPALGLAGTPMTEARYDAAVDDIFNETDVFGACQVFRRECFERIGGYAEVKEGGIDWIAVRSARMHGWQTRSFLDKRFFHHRPMGQKHARALTARFRHGKKDYFLGNHPAWQALRVAYQCTRRPYLVGGVSLMAGYTWAAITRMPRPIGADLMEFHRREQLQRLRGMAVAFLRSLGV